MTILVLYIENDKTQTISNKNTKGRGLGKDNKHGTRSNSTTFLKQTNEQI